jgi:hypothetical protein
MVYFKMLTGKKATHVHDCSMLYSPIPILIFGGNELKPELIYGNRMTVSVDSFVRVSVDAPLGSLLVKARKTMDSYLQEKITNPWITNWSNPKIGEVKMMKVFIRLMTSQ